MFRPSSSTCRFSSRVPNRVSIFGLSSMLFFIRFYSEGRRAASRSSLGALSGWPFADEWIGTSGFCKSGFYTPGFYAQGLSLRWKLPERAPAWRGQPSFDSSVARAGGGVNGRRAIIGGPVSGWATLGSGPNRLLDIPFTPYIVMNDLPSR
jgi:hypothetical protein